MATNRDLNKVGAILDAAIEAGAHNIHRVSFRIDDPDGPESEAWEQALAATLAKAEELAALHNAEVGDLISLSEMGGGGWGHFASSFASVRCAAWEMAALSPRASWSCLLGWRSSMVSSRWSSSGIGLGRTPASEMVNGTGGICPDRLIVTRVVGPPMADTAGEAKNPQPATTRTRQHSHRRKILHEI